MTYKNKAKQRESVRKAVHKHRQGITEGITSEQGITPSPVMEGITPSEGITCPDIIDKLTDPFWRPRLEKICNAFQSSHHSSFAEMCWLGDTNLSLACDWLECTSRTTTINNKP